MIFKLFIMLLKKKVIYNESQIFNDETTSNNQVIRLKWSQVVDELSLQRIIKENPNLTYNRNNY